MIKKYLYFFFFLGIWANFSACESQDKYILETKTAFFLAKDAQTSQKQLISLTKSGANQLKLHELLGISATNLGDIAGKDNLFWVSEISPAKLHRLNPKTQTLEKSVNLAELQPTFLCIGEKHLLIGDSLTNKIGFWDIKSGKLAGLQTVEAKPLAAEWNAGKFYISFDNQTLAVYSEDSYSYRTKVSLPNRIEGLLVSINTSEVSLLIQTRNANDSLRESHLDLQADNFSDAQDIEKKPNPYYHKKEVSPYTYAPFGKETTTDMRLLNQKISPISLLTHPTFSNQNIANFEMDFFDSDLYLLQNDSLKVYSLFQKRYLQKFAYNGNLLKAYYYRDFQGE